MNKQRFLDELTDVFFPTGIKCIICGDDISSESRFPICSECRPEYVTAYCLTCGRKTVAANQYCPICKEKSWSFSKARAPFAYRGDIKRLIHRLKYGNCKYIAKEVAVYLADTYYEHNLMSDIITFVPMFPKKKKSRGYNQAEELARFLSEKVGGLFERLLDKVTQTKSNASQKAEQRLESVKDSFSIAKDSDGKPVDVKGKRILLVDDVFTTGATVNECAKILMAAKAEEVNVLTLATAIASVKPKEKKVELRDIPSV